MANDVAPQARTVRVFVEPVEVEVEDDGSLAWTSIQTAFPGCSGMYFKGSECRGAVKFDGTKFRAPPGGWDQREFFVSLGPRSSQFPFGSYENASRQFERSVSAVQRMLGNGIFEMPHRRSTRTSKTSMTPLTQSLELNGSECRKDTISPPNVPSVPHPRRESKNEHREPTVDKVEHNALQAHSIGSEKRHLLNGIQERERSLRSSKHNLSPIEQQFVDLARISTGKDAIIDGQRDELRKMKEELELAQRLATTLEAEVTSCRQRIQAQEDELNMLRKMGAEQTNMCEKVASLTTQLLRKDDELSVSRAEAALKVASLQKLTDELTSTNEALSTSLEEARNHINTLQVERQKLQADCTQMEAEIDVLRPIRDVLHIETVIQAESMKAQMERYEKNKEELEKQSETLEQIETKHKEIQDMSSKLTEENSRLLERNRELESRLELFENELSAINQRWKDSTKEKDDEWQKKRNELEKEVEEMRSELESVQQTLQAVARDAASNAQRASEMEHSRDELRKLLDAQEQKTQEPLKRQIRNLSDQLDESQERVKELNNLVASLTSEAKSSQHDVADFYYGAGTI